MSTTAELVTLVRDRFGEDSTTATQITDAQILKFLNSRQVELCADSNCLVSGWIASTVNAQQRYSVPAEYLSVEDIQFFNATYGKYWLDKGPLRSLDATQGVGAPVKFSVWGANVSGDNSPTFFLDPIPNFSGTNDLICYGRQLPKTMVSGGQGPEVRQAEQYVTVLGAVAEVYARLAASDVSLIPLMDRAEAKWQRAKTETQRRYEIEYRTPVGPIDSMRYTL